MLAPLTVPSLKASGRAFAHIAQFVPELTALRRDLHAHPDLGFGERYTSRRVQAALEVCGVDEIHAGIKITMSELKHAGISVVDSARSDAEGSTGLGLSIVSAIMNLHGGKATVQSNGLDTRFILAFPIGEEG